jgi:hypothetical protein
MFVNQRTGRVLRPLGLALLAIWAATACADAARTTHAFPPPVLLSRTGTVYGAAAGTDGSGNVLLTWVRTQGFGIDDLYSGSVYARAFVDGEWGRTIRVSRLGRSTDVESVDLEVTSNGAAVALWFEPSHVTRVLISTSRAPWRRWSRPRVLALGDDIVDSAIGRDRTIVLLRERGRRLETATFSGTGRFVRNDAAPEAGPYVEPTLATGDANTLVWTRCTSGDRHPCRASRPQQYVATTRQGTGGWGPTATVAGAPPESSFWGAVGTPAGDASVFWVDSRETLTTAVRHDGVWRGPVPLSEPSDFDDLDGGSYGDWAIDRDGDALVIWGAFSADKRLPDALTLQAHVKRASDDVWRGSSLLDWAAGLQAGAIDPGPVQAAAGGRAIATWVVDHSLLAETGDVARDEWTEPVPVARVRSPNHIAVAAGDDGTNVVAWAIETDTADRIYATVERP